MKHLCVLALLIGGCGGPDGKGQEENTTSEPDETTEALDVSRVVLHRLNRDEYNRTVQDLLGTKLTPADNFPTDDHVAGFDNIASNLTVSPLHVELYELAAEELADEALKVPITEPEIFFAEAEGIYVTVDTGGIAAGGWGLWSNGTLSYRFDAPAAGTYLLRTRVWANQGGPELAMAELGIDGLPGQVFEVEAESNTSAEQLEVEVELVAGPHTVSVSFLNDYWEEGVADRNLYVDWISATGPIGVEAGDNAIRDQLVPCDPEDAGERECAETVLAAIAPKAWRRPLDPAELASLMEVVDLVLADGGTFDDAAKYGLMAVLTSPHFIYRTEFVPNPTSEEAQPLDGYAIASRLSYFLWSSMPDDELFAAAENGDLATSEGIEEQVKRMLADDRSAALVDNFMGQWLQTRGLDDKSPDPALFPEFTPELRDSMREEMRRFLDTFVAEPRDVRELLSATSGEIDARLAEHYEISGHTGGWQEVDLSAHDRGGILGHAGLLTINSYPARTSPVVRGKFVLGKLLCDEPNPPPPGVEGLVEADAPALTLREQLEQHREDPVCASCHEVMDPLGFGQEHFDPIGRWRDEDRGLPIDALGELPDGQTFYGNREMASVVAADPEFVGCVAEQMWVYGLGRTYRYTDEPFLEFVVDDFASGNFTFEALAVAIATSSPFRMSRGEP